MIYPLPEVLLLVLGATLAGADDFVEIVAWGEERLDDFLRRFLPYADGTPSHDTLNDVINALDPELFAAGFTAWVEGLREAEPDIGAVDGKTSRRTHARARGREPLHPVSAWASRQRLVPGQRATDAKSDEITAIPLLLARLALTGALVTVDAMGCRREIARAIIDGGADYLLAVKANRPALHGEVARYFADAPASELDTGGATTEGDHGRIEVRRHAVSRTPSAAPSTGSRPTAGSPASRASRGWPPSPWSRRRSNAPARPPAASGATSCRPRRSTRAPSPMPCAPTGASRTASTGCSTSSAATTYAALRTGHGPENMATVRHMAVNLVGTASGRHSLKVRRKRAAWNVGYLEALLRQAP